MSRSGSEKPLVYVAWILGVAVAYVAVAEIGFSLAFAVRQVTAVWPPTGLAIAVLVLGGYRLWPGIWLGAFVANFSTNEPFLVAAAIASGNTLAPLAGTYLLRAFHFEHTFSRIRDVLIFVVFAAIVAMTISASNGFVQLALGHIVPWSAFGSVWTLWWTGDAMGVLLVAPLILTWSDVRRNGIIQGDAGPLEVTIVALLMVAVSSIEFLIRLPQPFPLYPFVVWSALRVGPRVTSAAILLLGILAVWGTVHNVGPFSVSGTLDQRLMALVIFMSVLSITGLILSAITSERRTAVRNLEVAERRFKVLAETVPQLVWTADASGTIDWFNQRWKQYTGNQEFPQPIADWHHLIAAGEPFEREINLRRQDGMYRWFLLRAEPMHDRKQRIVRWYGTLTDIDDQRRAVERSARIAKTLQAAFLPATLPRHSNLRLDALYLTAGREALIGGDWYDALTLPDRRILISIGDVTGHGLNAAVTAGRIRQSIVAAAIDRPDPATILMKVNRLLHLRDLEVATAVIALVDVDAMTMHYASAGHPPPIVGSPKERAHTLSYGSLPLGVASTTEYLGKFVTLDPDAHILFYTDGVTEFQRDIEAAEHALCNAVDRLVAGPPLAHPADAIRRSVIGTETPSDDAVLMIVHVAPSGATQSDSRDIVDLRKSWSFHSTHAYSAHSARSEVMRFISGLADANADLFNAELIVGEILANTVEHAPGLVNMEIDWSDEAPVVTVLDTGPGLDQFKADLPKDDFTEDGRGLFLVKMLARDVRVESAQGYGTKLTVVLPIDRQAV